MYSSDYVWAKIINYLEEHLTAATASSFFDDAKSISIDRSIYNVYTMSKRRD